MNYSRTALRTIPNTTDTEEHTIEKILAKRFNPRRREHEYLVKWENISHELNTWEPHSHITSCPQLLDNFEKQLARQKEQRAAQLAKQQAAAAAEAAEASQNEKALNDSISPVRPQRNSKAKAMDNVKQWCADNAEAANEAAKKRKSEDSDYEDSTDENGMPPTKIMKTSNTSSPTAVAQALIKAGQSGSVRIVPVNKNNNAAAKTNGNAFKSPEKSEREWLIANVKEGKHTGIVKKPGATVTPVIISTFFYFTSSNNCVCV